MDEMVFKGANVSPKFVYPDLDILSYITPDKLIDWLKEKVDGFHVSGNYGEDIFRMCEYSCFFGLLKIVHTPHLANLSIISGFYSFRRHWWLKYNLNGTIYFLDLTLQQFDPNAPKMAITLAAESTSKYLYKIEQLYTAEEYSIYITNPHINCEVV